jgi:hypothetical protein
VRPLQRLALLFLVPVTLAAGLPAQAGPVGQSLDSYAAECRARVSAIPAFDCGDGVEAAITVNGQVVPFTSGMSCDRPALLDYGPDSDGQCVPGSRALLLADNEQVQISAFCRKKFYRPGADQQHLYDEIDVIAHNVSTGDTCWFHAESPARDQPLDGRRVPPPGEQVAPPGAVMAADFWWPPERTASKGCGNCHDNDPFYYSPYIAQTGQLPANPFGKYRHVGEAFKAWPAPRSMDVRGNTCLGCHRIGVTHTCGDGARQTINDGASPGLDSWAKSWPQSHWMPVDHDLVTAEWVLRYARSMSEIEACCAAVKNNTALPANCSLSPVPSG